MATTLLQCSNVSYNITNSNILFKEINSSFKLSKYGIVGDNGSGKTTFLKLLAGIVKPDIGRVHVSTNIIYIPQNIDKNIKVSDIFGISNNLAAINRINNGSCNQKDFDLAEGYWDSKTLTEEKIYSFFRIKIDLNHKLKTYSGGEQTKILLTKAILSPCNIIILDEPTNSLDISSKEIFFEWLNTTNKCVIIASHDRCLLECMNHTIEIIDNCLIQYGGGFSLYEKQKNISQQRILHEIKNSEKNILRINESIQETKEKQVQRSSIGKNLRKSRSINNLSANSMKERSEKTSSKNSSLANHMLINAKNQLLKAKEKLIIEKPINIALPNTYVPSSKLIVNIENLCFSYQQNIKIFDNFNLKISGPERIVLDGLNGSGKSTLFRLIKQELKPTSGNIKTYIKSIGYIDQHNSILQDELSLIDNVRYFNSSYNTQQAYALLAQYKFRGELVYKKIKNLSGGERIRVGLAMCLITKNTPQLLLLDEPTNHLDIKNIKLLEQAINCYNGAIIIVSHDSLFLRNISISRKIYL